MRQQEKNNFQNKAVLGHGRNVFGKTSRDLAESLFALLSDLLFQVHPIRSVRPTAAFFWLHPQHNGMAFSLVFLLLIIGVTALAEQLTAAGQIYIHGLQSRHVHKSPRMDQVLHRLAVGSGNHLQTKAVEKAAFAGDFAPIVLAFDQPRMANADVVTDRDGKGVNHISFVHIQVFEKTSQVIKQDFKRMGQLVQPSVEGRLFKQHNALLISPVTPGRCLVAVKESGRHHSPGQYQPVAAAVGFVFGFSVGFPEEIIQKTINCQDFLRPGTPKTYLCCSRFKDKSWEYQVCFFVPCNLNYVVILKGTLMILFQNMEE